MTGRSAAPVTTTNATPAEPTATPADWQTTIRTATPPDDAHLCPDERSGGQDGEQRGQPKDGQGKR